MFPAVYNAPPLRPDIRRLPECSKAIYLSGGTIVLCCVHFHLLDALGALWPRSGCSNGQEPPSVVVGVVIRRTEKQGCSQHSLVVGRSSESEIRYAQREIDSNLALDRQRLQNYGASGPANQHLGTQAQAKSNIAAGADVTPS